MSGISPVKRRLCLLHWGITKSPGKHKHPISDHVCMEKCPVSKRLPLVWSDYTYIIYVAEVAIKINSNKPSFNSVHSQDHLRMRNYPVSTALKAPVWYKMLKILRKRYRQTELELSRSYLLVSEVPQEPHWEGQRTHSGLS